MSTPLLIRFGPGAGPVNHPLAALSTGSPSFGSPHDNNNSQPASPAETSFNGLASGRADTPPNVQGGGQGFGYDTGTQAQYTLDMHLDEDSPHTHNVTDGLAFLPNHTHSPFGEISSSPSHHTPLGSRSGSQGYGRTNTHSREQSISRSSSGSAPLILAGTRRRRGSESEHSQPRSGSTTHQLRAFATRTTVDLRLSSAQSEELAKMAEVGSFSRSNQSQS